MVIFYIIDWHLFNWMKQIEVEYQCYTLLATS